MWLLPRMLSYLQTQCTHTQNTHTLIPSPLQTQCTHNTTHIHLSHPRDLSSNPTSSGTRPHPSVVQSRWALFSFVTLIMVGEYTVDSWRAQGLGVQTLHTVKRISTSQNLHITSDSPKTTTNNLLLTGSLLDNTNSQLAHILYVIRIIFFVLTMK